MTADEIEQLRQEHLALMLSYCEVQQRCSAQIQSLTRKVEALSQQLIRCRAQLIASDSALWPGNESCAKPWSCSS